MSDTHSDESATEILQRIFSTVHTKVAAVIFALADGQAMKGVDRDGLIVPLTELGVGNVPSTLQRARIENQGDGCYKHNGKQGNQARLAVTERGVAMVKKLFTNEQGQLDQDALDWVVDKIQELGQAGAAEPGEAAEGEDQDDGPPSSKRARRSASATAGGAASAPQSPGAATTVAEVEVDAIPDTDEEDADVPSALEKRLKALLAQHDAAIDQDALGELYGKESALFYQAHKRAPTAEEASALLRGAKTEQSAMTTIGQGAVSRAQISTLLRKVRDVQQLPELVRSLEARAAAA